MADSVIKYITINNVLYKIEEYTYKGYAGSYHKGNSMTRVANEDVEKIKKMVEEKGEEIPERNYRLNCDWKQHC